MPCAPTPTPTTPLVLVGCWGFGASRLLIKSEHHHHHVYLLAFTPGSDLATTLVHVYPLKLKLKLSQTNEFS